MKKLHLREIDDNNFQKVKWKKNKIQFNLPSYSTLTLNYLQKPKPNENIDVFSWIEQNLAGLWHYKENWQILATKHKIIHTFWFELPEDATLFKLTWWQ